MKLTIGPGWLLLIFGIFILPSTVPKAECIKVGYAHMVIIDSLSGKTEFRWK